MQLARDDLSDWAESQGVELPSGPSGRPEQGQGGGPFADMSEEERAAFRAELQNMSEEERAARFAELGIERRGDGNRGQGGFANRFNATFDPLIDLLTARAAE